MKFLPMFLVTCFLTTFAQTTVANSAPTTASHPRWALHWSSGKGSFWLDQPNCHSLGYFSSSPKQFDFGHDLYGVKLAGNKEKVERKSIGEVQGFAIRQILHTIPMEGWDLFIKMILVERRPGEFCEIDNAEYDAPMDSIDPASILDLNSEKVLATRDRVSGNGNFYIEEYWTFDKQGPIPLDQGVIYETLKKLLPKGKDVLNGGGFDIGKLCYAMPVWQVGDAHCCPSAGTVQIKFALENDQLVVVKQKYNPSPSQQEQDNPMACTP